MVNMSSSGVIYTFNIAFLINALVTGLVLLASANILADFVAFRCLGGGQSTVLRNKRAEKVSKKSEFAEVGLRAALAAFQFKFFDCDHNGWFNSMDICRAFANISGANGEAAVTAEQAHAIANVIMKDADNETSELGDAGALNFSEFMTCIDGGAINFKDFLTRVETRKDDEDYAECLESYNEQRKVVEARKKKRKPFSERHPSMAATMIEDKSNKAKSRSSLSRSRLTSTASGRTQRRSRTSSETGASVGQDISTMPMSTSSV